MSDLLAAPWFYWAVGLAIGLPLALVVLTEWQQVLRRRGSLLLRPVTLLRNVLLPAGALLLLMTGATQMPVDSPPVRIVGTLVAFAVLVLLLSGVKASVFSSAPQESWRQRVPGIFLDVIRFALIAVGAGLIFAYIWGANVGGLFTALGISSIVLGLTLQNSVGQIISGLLLLFEQPFQIGDWVQTTSATGRVVEVNWRATHINTGSGLEIIPNSVLAGQSFMNLSRPPGGHTITVTSKFSGADAPDDVCALLTDVAADLPQLHADSRPVTTVTGSAEYTTVIPVRSPADDVLARSTFQRWLWYASRRAGLHLDGMDDDFPTLARRVDALRKIAPVLRATSPDLEALLPHVTVTRYGADELMQVSGDIPASMSFVVKGRVRLVVTGTDGSVIPVGTLHQGDFIGQTALTREPVVGSAYALGEVTVLQIKRDTVEKLVFRKPELLQDLSQAIDERRDRVREAASHDKQSNAEAESAAS